MKNKSPIESPLTPEPETKYTRGWIANQFKQIKLDSARRARKEWLEAEPWVREQILREENDKGVDSAGGVGHDLLGGRNRPYGDVFRA